MGTVVKRRMVSGAERINLINEYEYERDKCQKITDHTPVTSCGRANKQIATGMLSYAKKQLDLLSRGMADINVDICDMCGRERELIEIEDVDWEVCGRCAKILKVLDFVACLFIRKH